MATLTVYVPDDDHKRIDSYKDRLNLSQLARKCIMREVERLEAAERQPGERATLIARLRREKEDAMDRSLQEGLEFGTKSASETNVWTYGNFVQLYDAWQQLQGLKPQDGYWSVLPEGIQEYLTDELDDLGGHLFEAIDLEQWCRGFILGALDVWRQVRSEL